MKHGFFLLYSVVLLCFSVFSYLFIDPNLLYFKNFYSGFFAEQRIITTSLYIFFLFIFFLFYLVILWMIYKHKVQKRQLFWIIGATVGILFFSYPAILSYDIFNYITTAKVAFFYHENPYVVMPIEFIDEPFLSFTHAANKLALYAPFWIILTGMPYLLSFGNFIFLLFGFKLLVSVFYVATIVLLWKMTKNSFSVAVFALNPLVIIETVVSGHNDIVMMFFVLLSFYLLKQGKMALGLLAISMSIFIKYATIILLPIFFYVAWIIVRKQNINWDTIFRVCAGAMFFVFLLSPLREEIYPWYAIWFLLFLPLIPIRKLFFYIFIAFSLGLLLRYVPFMLFGTYIGQTPLIKTIVTFSFPIFVFLYLLFKRKLWVKTFFQ